MSRFRGQEGFTLIEMLVAASIGFVVLSAALGLLESTLRLDNGVMAKTDAQQRGRLAMDRITQELRSQVCLNLTTPAILPVKSTADSVTFYADFGDDIKAPPMLRTITYDNTSGEISESDVKGKVLPSGAFDYTDPPTKQIIVQGAARVTESDGTVRPFLKYFAYETKNGVLGTTQELLPPLANAAAARVARIEISFTARPTGATDNTNATDIKDEISVRHADPNLTVPDPQCV
jgi:prepilin-type N-terminal cleavage/methylation domain-containing protein